MTGYIVRRLLATIPVLLVVALTVFGLIHLVPGDPAAIIAGPDASIEEHEAIRESMGLNRPLPVQLGVYFRGSSAG